MQSCGGQLEVPPAAGAQKPGLRAGQLGWAVGSPQVPIRLVGKWGVSLPEKAVIWVLLPHVGSWDPGNSRAGNTLICKYGADPWGWGWGGGINTASPQLEALLASGGSC